MDLQSMSVTILFDKYRKLTDRDIATDEFQKKWRVSHILGKLPFLIPEVDNLELTEDPLEEMRFPSFPPNYPRPPGDARFMPYACSNLTQFYNNKAINLRPFKASEGARALINNSISDNVITISLRTAKFHPVRNSNLDEWYKVYQELKKTKFKPIVIPDFEDYVGDKKFSKYDWEIYDPAVMDLDLRLALYEKAVDNLCINNGINGLLVFSDCKYHIFKFINYAVPATSEKFHKLNHGISWGENYKFAAATGQRLIWEDDDADIILKTLNL